MTVRTIQTFKRECPPRRFICVFPPPEAGETRIKTLCLGHSLSGRERGEVYCETRDYLLFYWPQAGEAALA